MSAEIQNELLECAASLLLQKVKAEMHETPYTYYVADECKDISKQELVVRYVHSGKVKERAVGFVETGDVRQWDFIEPLQLDSSLCVGFCFDGASVMSGNRGDVHLILKLTFLNDLYVHCNSHRLNLFSARHRRYLGMSILFFNCELFAYFHDWWLVHTGILDF